MTIRSGTHMSARPFFVRLPRGKSTSQQVNKLVSDRSYKPDSADATKRKSPLAPKFASVVAYINHNIS